MNGLKNKREFFLVVLPLVIATILTIAIPPAINHLIDAGQLEDAKYWVRWGAIFIFWAMIVFDILLIKYQNRIVHQTADVSRSAIEVSEELLNGYKESIAQLNRATTQINRDTKTLDETRKLTQMILGQKGIIMPALEMIENILGKLNEYDNLPTDALPSIRTLPLDKQDYASRIAALQSDLEAMIDYRFGIFPRRGPGRPAGVISIPTANGQAINQPIKDQAVMAYLLRLQEAKARGELAQACNENPWGGSAIPESTARDWLKRYQADIDDARNSGNYS